MAILNGFLRPIVPTSQWDKMASQHWMINPRHVTQSILRQ